MLLNTLKQTHKCTAYSASIIFSSVTGVLQHDFSSKVQKDIHKL